MALINGQKMKAIMTMMTGKIKGSAIFQSRPKMVRIRFDGLRLMGGNTDVFASIVTGFSIKKSFFDQCTK
jgi:hypothetical protein